MGWFLTAFLVGYTVSQVQGAVVGGWLGARRTVTAIGLLTAVLATCATSLAPIVSVAAALFPQFCR